MIRRFAANYLLIPGIGFFRQSVLEIDDEGVVARVFELTEEGENTSWIPGLLVLRRRDGAGEVSELLPEDVVLPEVCRSYPDIPEHYFREYRFDLFRVYPFDFVCMKPTGDSRYYRLIP